MSERVDRQIDVAGEAEAASSRPWQARLAPFARPDDRVAARQLLSSALPFALGCGAMAAVLPWSPLLTVALAVPTAGFYIRLFLIQHDCGHGSFFSSRRANEGLGTLLGVLTLTPFHYWRRAHAHHHSAHGDLDHRGPGDLTTWTVREYEASGFWPRLGYRLSRNVPLLLIFGPLYQILLKHRFPWDMPRSWRREWRGVWITNAGLGLGTWGAVEAVGAYTFLWVATPIFCVAWGAALWVLYVQHHFEDTYWRPHRSWSFEEAALHGSSFYDLPPILHWFTADIGYHHIHHLLPRVPNYRLRECFEAFPELRRVKRITLKESLRCARLALWDEDRERMISFGDLPALAPSLDGLPAERS